MNRHNHISSRTAGGSLVTGSSPSANYFCGWYFPSSPPGAQRWWNPQWCEMLGTVNGFAMLISLRTNSCQVSSLWWSDLSNESLSLNYIGNKARTRPGIKISTPPHHEKTKWLHRGIFWLLDGGHIIYELQIFAVELWKFFTNWVSILCVLIMITIRNIIWNGFCRHIQQNPSI